MICNKCGTQNNDGSKFCIGCGNNLEMIQQPVMPSTSNTGLINNTMNNNIPIQPTVGNTLVNNIQNEPTINNHKQNKLNKKMLLIIGGVVVAIIVIIILLIFILGGNNKSKDLISVIDLDQPIPVYKDGSYVYIDTSGKIIKNIKYNQASDFSGDYAFVELEDGTAALIDKSQNVKVSATSYYAMQYISEYDLWLIDGVLYDGKLKAITDNSISLMYSKKGFFTYNNSDYTEYGIINSEGKKIYKNNCLIDSLNVNDYSGDDEYYAILKTTCYENDVQTEKEYLIELQNGKILYENKYKEQYPNSYYYYLSSTYNNIFYIVDDSYDKIEYMYLNNNEIIYSTKEPLYALELYGTNYLKLDYGYSYENLGKEQRYYYYDIKNKKLVDEEPKIDLEDINIEVQKDITERQIVSCGNKKGLIDDKNVIIPCIYDDIDTLPESVHEYLKAKESKDLVYVENSNEETILYDANDRKEFIKLESAENYAIDDYSNSLLIKQKIYVDRSWSSNIEKTIVYNLLTGERIIFDSNSDIEIKSNYFIETKNGKKIYYNMNFEKIYTQ